MYVKRRGSVIAIEPYNWQPGDIICDANGTPLRDQRSRRYDR